MNDLAPQKCPRCGTELPAGSLGGVCPRCAAGLLQATQTDLSGTVNPPFTPPTVEELAAKFPQLEVLELIGRGGMGAVYKARQKELDRIVALKILPPDSGRDAAFADRFAREAKALAKLNHPGIVTIYDFGRADGLYFFLMEYVDGMNLRELLHHSRISAREALAIVPQICDALQFAHDQGIVHRDIKPENLLIDRRGRVKVADFGLAKIIEPESGGIGESDDRDSERAKPVTDRRSGVMGTPHYMSPEQVEHPGAVDHRADIYALGVVFYQMLTGELPEKPLLPPSQKVRIDVRLDEVVLRALEQKPELRYQQASDIKTCVETIAANPELGGSRHEEAQTEKPNEDKNQSIQTSSPASGTSPPASPPRISPCQVSTPEFLRTFRGRFLHNFQGRGELRLDNETLSFDSGWSVVTIPLSSISGMYLGLYPWLWPVRIIPLLYIAVTFTEHGVARTLLFTPTRSGVMSRQETNKLVQEWLWILWEAVRSRTKRALSLKPTDEALAPAWMRSTPWWVWYLGTVAACTVIFTVETRILSHRPPNWFDLLAGPIVATFVHGSLWTRQWWHRRRLSALTAGGPRAVPPGAAVPAGPGGTTSLVQQGLLWLPEQVLLLFDFTAKVPGHVKRAGRRCFNFWPCLLFNCSNLGFIITGESLAFGLAAWWLHHRMQLGDLEPCLMVFGLSGVGRLAALNMGFNEEAADGRLPTTRGITRRRVVIVFLTWLGMAVLTLGMMPWLGTTLDTLSPDAISRLAAKLKWGGIIILVVAGIGVFARIGFLLIRFVYRELVRSWPVVKQATEAAMKPAADVRAFSNPLPNRLADAEVNCPLTMEVWLAVMDGEDFAQSWELAGESLQHRTTREEWVERLDKVRRPLGKVRSRKLSSMTPIILGSCWEAMYDTSFDGLPAAVETVTYALEANGEWRATGYLIGPRSVPIDVTKAPLFGLTGWLKRRTSRRSFRGDGPWPQPQPPFKSPLTRAQMRELRAHLTGAEMLSCQKLAGILAIWNSATFFLPFAFIMIFPIPVPLNWIIASAVLLVGLAFYPLWWKQQANLLCASAWARAKGIQPEAIRLFPLGSTGLMLVGVLWMALVGGLWWQTYRPEGVWLPWLAKASIKEPGPGGAVCVTEVRQYGQIVWLRLTCDPLPRSARLAPAYTGPLIELPYHLPRQATNADCLFTTAPHSTGKIIAGTNDLSGHTNFTVAFVLPDEPAAAAAVKQVRRMNLNKPHGVDSPLFALHRTLGKDSSGKIMAEDIFGVLQLQARQRPAPIILPPSPAGASFIVTTNGTSPLYYQWSFSDTNLPGKAQNLSISPVLPGTNEKPASAQPAKFP